MEHVFWLIRDRLAGRPGPNRAPWDLGALRSAGFEAVLSLNDGEGCDPEALSTLGFDYLCVPLPPNEPPEFGDEENCHINLSSAYDFVEKSLQRRHRVLVHCSAGKDRTGLFMAFFLMRQYGLDLDQAIAQVRIVQPRALTAAGCEALARRVLARLENENW